MRSPGRGGGGEVPDPSFERADDGASRRDAQWLVAQQLHELTADSGRHSAIVDRLVSDVAEMSRQMQALTHTISIVKGAVIATVALVPATGVLLWWLIGGQLGHLRDQLYRSTPAAAAASSATPPNAGNPRP